jgi:hypothetical protein
LHYIRLVPKPTEYTVHIPEISNYLYECPIGLNVHIYQENKFISQSGAFPERRTKKLEKGNYRLIVQLRHHEDSLLERFKDLPIELHWKLATPISLDGYKTHEEAFKGDGTKVNKFQMRPGRHIRCFFSPIQEDK